MFAHKLPSKHVTRLLQCSMTAAQLNNLANHAVAIVIEQYLAAGQKFLHTLGSSSFREQFGHQQVFCTQVVLVLENTAWPNPEMQALYQSWQDRLQACWQAESKPDALEQAGFDRVFEVRSFCLCMPASLEDWWTLPYKSNCLYPHLMILCQACSPLVLAQRAVVCPPLPNTESSCLS